MGIQEQLAYLLDEQRGDYRKVVLHITCGPDANRRNWDKCQYEWIHEKMIRPFEDLPRGRRKRSSPNAYVPVIDQGSPRRARVASVAKNATAPSRHHAAASASRGPGDVAGWNGNNGSATVDNRNGYGSRGSTVLQLPSALTARNGRVPSKLRLSWDEDEEPRRQTYAHAGRGLFDGDGGGAGATRASDDVMSPNTAAIAGAATDADDALYLETVRAAEALLNDSDDSLSADGDVIGTHGNDDTAKLTNSYSNAASAVDAALGNDADDALGEGSGDEDGIKLPELDGEAFLQAVQAVDSALGDDQFSTGEGGEDEQNPLVEKNSGNDGDYEEETPIGVCNQDDLDDDEDAPADRETNETAKSMQSMLTDDGVRRSGLELPATPLRKGSWSQQEKESYHTAFSLFGKHWAKIAAYVGGRSPKACESFYHERYKNQKRSDSIDEHVGDQNGEPPGDFAVDLDDVHVSSGMKAYASAPFLMSPYLQSLAEITYTLTHDRRWTLGTGMEQLFQSDLSAVKALSRRYCLPLGRKLVTCSCVLCEDGSDATPQSYSRPTPITAEEEPRDRSLYLYSRLFHSEEESFPLDDVYSKYYAPAEDIVDDPNSPSAQRRRNSSFAMEDGIVEKYLAGVKELLVDVRALIDMRLARAHQRGTKSGKSAPLNEENEMVDRLFEAICLEYGKTRNPLAATKLKQVLKMKSNYVFQKLTRYQVPTHFRLRRKPALILRRCIRLYLCATSGPARLSGTSHSEWMSVLAADGSSVLARSGSGPRSFYEVQYPPLDFRLGVHSSSFTRSFRRCSIYDSIGERHLYEEQVFPSSAAFFIWEVCVELRANVDYLLDEYKRQRDGRRAEESDSYTCVDCFKLLTPRGRTNFLQEFLGDFQPTATMKDWLKKELKFCLNSVNEDSAKILVVVAVLGTAILSHRNQYISDEELALSRDRPWLRHLQWDGCLAQILYDIVPLFEENQLFHTATCLLETLVFGIAPYRMEKLGPYVLPHLEQSTRLAPLLLARQIRGEAVDMLIKATCQVYRIETVGIGEEFLRKTMFKAYRRSVVALCKSVVESAVDTCCVPFSAVRSLAKRLHRPLSVTLRGKSCYEARELGIRLENATNASSSVQEEFPWTLIVHKGYRDWKTDIDRVPLKAMAESGVDSPSAACSSEGRRFQLQLAIAFYNAERSPLLLRQGCKWTGWQGGGEKLLALFRILCYPLLGSDWGSYASPEYKRDSFSPSLVLTPYQEAPLDLFVGFNMQSQNHSQDDRRGSGNNPKRAGIYFRRRALIDEFLTKLSVMDSQALCDLVHEFVSDHVRFATKHQQSDPSLEQDVQQLRILSLVAAGCGGKQLSAVFRCLLFDYNTYCEGLPSLLLARVSVGDDDSAKSEALDLNEWLGEDFARTSHKSQDDHQDGADGKSSTRNDDRSEDRTPGSPPDFLPPRLDLLVSGRKVNVECAMLAVIENGRLEPCQEDWLNLLNRDGCARACKFEECSQSQVLDGVENEQNGTPTTTAAAAATSA